MAKPVTLLKWTGRGKFSDLKSSVEFMLKERKIRGVVDGFADAVIVEGPDPVLVCTLFASLPGVAWAAAGFRARDRGELLEVSAKLAKNYLRAGTRFSVSAEVPKGTAPSDVSGPVTSAILESVKGARVSTDARVKFRASYDGRQRVLGIELRDGPGGVPTGSRRATCLVSGGKHSSVVAWYSVLMGYNVTLVHAKEDDASLYAVAKLYAELSHRSDPRGLTLEVLQGGKPAPSLGGYLLGREGVVFGGLTSAGQEPPPLIKGALGSPLYLLPEERFDSEFASLRLKGHDSRTDWSVTGEKAPRVRRFGGRMADVSGVLDGLV